MPPPFPLPEIPIILISLSLVPIDLFGFGGPPLGPMGIMYLQMFHSKLGIGRLILGQSENEKEAQRCLLRNPQDGSPPIPLLANVGRCPVIQELPADVSDCGPGDPGQPTGGAPPPPDVGDTELVDLLSDVTESDDPSSDDPFAIDEEES